MIIIKNLFSKKLKSKFKKLNLSKNELNFFINLKQKYDFDKEIIHFISQNNELMKIPITRYPVEAKLVPDVNKMTKIVPSLRSEYFSFHECRVTRCCSCSRIRSKVKAIIPVNHLKVIQSFISMN